MNRKKFNEEVYTKKIQLGEIEDWETKFKIKKILNLIGNNKRILDLGCANGFISKKIQERNNEVIGIEISSTNVKICNEKGIKCIELDIEENEFPFPINSFDVVYAGELIEHLIDTSGFLQKIKKVLKKDGYLVLTTPNIAALTRRIKLLFGINPHLETCLEEGAGHLRYFTFKSLKDLLIKNGFYIKNSTTDFISLHKLKMVKISKIFPALGRQIIIKAGIKN